MSCIFSDSDFHLAVFLTTIETSAQDLNVSWQSRLFYLGRYIAFNMIEEDVTKELSLLLLAVLVFIIVNLVFFKFILRGCCMIRVSGVWLNWQRVCATGWQDVWLSDVSSCFITIPPIPTPHTNYKQFTLQLSPVFLNWRSWRSWGS